MTNILIFPKLQKSSVPEIKNDEDIEKISTHYTYQFYELMKNHGVHDGPSYHKDLGFLSEVLKSIIMRTQGMHHSIQDWMDDAFIEELHGKNDFVLADGVSSIDMEGDEDSIS